MACLWEHGLVLGTACLFREQQLLIGPASACDVQVLLLDSAFARCAAVADIGALVQLRRPFQGSNVAVSPGHRTLSARMAVQAGPASAYKPAKPTLFDIPLSNHGARVSSHHALRSEALLRDTPVRPHTSRAQNRYVIYKKGLESEIDITSPKELGGLRSEQYLALNPEGKMPILVLPDGTVIPECEVRPISVLTFHRSAKLPLACYCVPLQEACICAGIVGRQHDPCASRLVKMHSMQGIRHVACLTLTWKRLSQGRHSAK